MDYRRAPEARSDFMSSLYEQNTDSMSTAAGSNGAPSENPATETTDEEIDGKIFQVCTTCNAYIIKQIEDGGMEVVGDVLGDVLGCLQQ